jgi:carbon storage regulator
MLILSRKQDESIQIGDNIVISVARIQGNRVHIAVGAPGNVPVVRSELIPAAASGSDGSTIAPLRRIRRAVRHER